MRTILTNKFRLANIALAMCIIASVFPIPSHAQEEKEAKPWISGRFDVGFDTEWSDYETDIDLFQKLQLRIDPPNHDKIHVRTSLWLDEDLDSDRHSYGALSDINDASDSNVSLRLLYLYLDVDDLWGDSTLRIGRQRIQDGAAWNRIDGVYFKKRMPRWDIYAFGGARASVYADTHDDGVAGGGVSLRPFASTRIALDAYIGEEHRLYKDTRSLDRLFSFIFSSVPDDKLQDSLVSLSLWQSITPNTRLFARYSLQDGEHSEVSIAATGYVPALKLTYDVSYRSQLDDISDSISDLVGYTRILGNENAYQNFMVVLHRPLTEKFSLSLEGEIHDAENDSIFTANRDYTRYAVILAASDLFEVYDASVAFENWDGNSGDGFWTVSGEVARNWDKVRLAIGADFERYKDRLIAYNSLPLEIDDAITSLLPFTYPGLRPWVWLTDTMVVETSEDVRSVYAKLKWELKENQDLTARVVYENDDGPDSPYWRVRANYSIRF